MVNRITKALKSLHDRIPEPFLVDKEHAKFLRKGGSGRIIFAGDIRKEFENRTISPKGNASMGITFPEAWIEDVDFSIRNDEQKGTLIWVIPDDCDEGIIIICKLNGKFLKKFAKDEKK